MNPIQNPTFHKILPNTPKARLEIELQTIASDYGFAPRIYEVLELDSHSIVCMERLHGISLDKKYGTNAGRVPQYVWQQIKSILQILYNETIEYVEIAPHNFIEAYDGKIYIINFGEAYYTIEDGSNVPMNRFLRNFLEVGHSWIRSIY
jgi:RIO-like serine/threonine protein kinase